jgi:NAD(P)H-hydrate epimerase
MKVLTAAQMREVDQRTMELGIPGVVLMENAGMRVVEFLAERFAPLDSHRIVVLCGKGNNGGDGLVVARQLFTRFHPRSLDVVVWGDAPAGIAMLEAYGFPVWREIPARARHATIVVDALLGTGVKGSATGRMLEGISEINTGFPLAKVVALDMPSGMPSDSGEPAGACARADYTVTFTAPKVSQVMPQNCDFIGELVVRPIGSPESLLEASQLSLIEPSMFRAVLTPRPKSGHKGTFGHALVVGGARGKSGAAAMSGMAALRAGAGLVTVASSAESLAPELMTGRLEDAASLAEGKTVVAMGPGLGRNAEAEALVRDVVERFAGPMVLDADALAVRVRGARLVLTPHPGEMSQMTGIPVEEIQRGRIAAARSFAGDRQVTLVLKGQRTLIAFPDGRVWINPTGTPALGTGGSGDVLTGLIAGLLAQFPSQPEAAVAGAVYMHGLAGELGARELGEKSLIATDILTYFPKALEACGHPSHGV